MTKIEKQARELFTKAVLAKGKCWLGPDGCDGGLDAHHIIPKQRLKRLPYLTDEQKMELVWDSRNGVPLCRAHHFTVTVGVHRFIPADIPDETKEFAYDHDIEWALQREVVGYEPA